MDLEHFLMGLILVGVGLTAKVVKDGLSDIGKVKIRIADCIYATAEAEAATLEMEEQSRSMEKEVNDLRKQVSELEEKEIELSTNLRAKKRGDAGKARTTFKVDMGKG
jgi:chaperonin cofactor prefoldin